MADTEEKVQAQPVEQTEDSADANQESKKREREEDGTNGDAKRLASAAEDANAPTSSVATDEVTEYVEVPDQHVGRVIGKAGASIRVMQNLSGAHIDVPQTCEEGSTFRKVKIVGKKTQLDYCRQLIMQKCDPNSAEAPIALPSDGSAITKVVNVPNDMVGKIIGKGGATIRTLQDLSGAHVDVAKAPDPGQTTRRITLTGAASQVNKCSELIDLKLSGQPLPGQAMPSMTGFMQPAGADEMKVLIPNDMVGKVIGKGGETIRSIQDQSGAHMDIAKECAPGTQQREISMKGTASQMAYCNLLLQQKVSNNDVNAPGYVQAYQHYVQIYQQTNGGSSNFGTQNTMNMGGNFGGQQYGQQQQQQQFGQPNAYGQQQADPYGSYYQQSQQQFGQQQFGQQQQYGQQQFNQFGNVGNVGTVGKSTTVSVPNEHVGLIIGKGGTTIKDIQMQSGAHVDIPPDMGTPTRELRVTGDANQIAICQALIQQKLQQTGMSH